MAEAGGAGDSPWDPALHLCQAPTPWFRAGGAPSSCVRLALQEALLVRRGCSMSVDPSVTNKGTGHRVPAQGTLPHPAPRPASPCPELRGPPAFLAFGPNPNRALTLAIQKARRRRASRPGTCVWGEAGRRGGEGAGLVQGPASLAHTPFEGSGLGGTTLRPASGRSRSGSDFPPSPRLEGQKSPRELAGRLVGAGTLRLHPRLNYSASVHV